MLENVWVHFQFLDAGPTKLDYYSLLGALTMAVFFSAMYYIQTLTAKNDPTDSWIASQFRRYLAMFKGIKKAARFYPIHLATIVLAIVGANILGIYHSDIFANEFIENPGSPNEIKAYTATFIVMNYFVIMYYFLILPLQLKLANNPAA